VGAHNGVGNIVGFAFFRIVGVADSELGLDKAGAQEFLNGLIPRLLLQLQDGRQGRGGRSCSSPVADCRGAGFMLLRNFSHTFHETRSLFRRLHFNRNGKLLLRYFHREHPRPTAAITPDCSGQIPAAHHAEVRSKS
jgi:hypothetical protein